ncbi:MAG: hypothetical protein NTX64_15245 [Elusimicrobia bacterium]|nr:hypothetical protein [Elusimicrobiota bacterium]
MNARTTPLRSALALLLASGLLLTSEARSSAAGPERMVFDQAGSLGDLVRSIKEDAADAARRSAPPVGEAKSAAPIVVTVPGLEESKIAIGGISYDDLADRWKKLFPGRPVDEEELHAQLAEMQAVKRMRASGIGAPPAPDDYVATSVGEFARNEGIAVEIVNLAWSRDPEDSDRTADAFAQRLLALRDSPETRGRALYIAAHSWGSVLIYEALMRLQQKGQIIDVEGLTTLGSPLVPSRLWVRAYKDMCDRKYHLQRSIVKPQGVRRWTNLWAALDPFSNALPAAGKNDRVDLPAVPYERRLLALLAFHRKDAIEDLAALRDSGKWHFSYLLGYKATLRTLHTEVSWDIPQMCAPDVLLASPAPLSHPYHSP